MLGRILNDAQARLLADERRWLSDLQVALARFDTAPEERALLDRSVRQLDELFLLVVVGEFNSGKSAFINALLGRPLLAEGVTPTTTRINVLKYGPEEGHVLQDPALEVVTAPIDLLHEINIVDTPGTNAILREHEAITHEFVPRSDMVLFVTSADRPFSESERAFLELIRDWGKKVVIVVNKIDILEKAAEVAQVESFVAGNAQQLLGVAPELFPLSARQAGRAKAAGDAALLATSRFEPLERYIVATLDEQERIRLKLRNPIGVGTRLATGALHTIDERLALLADDFRTLDDIERQATVYRADMQRDFRLRLASLENVLHAFQERGFNFFDDTIRLARILDLLNKTRLQAEFERKVVADVPQQIERQVNETIDWLVASNLAQWQAVTGHLNERRNLHSGRIVGQVGGSFAYDRDHLLETVGRAAQEAVDTYNPAAEADETARALQVAVAQTAAVEVGAVGLGALLVHLLSTLALDVTGVLAAGVVAALGFFVVPARREKAKRELRAKIAGMREQLDKALTAQFEHELERSLRQVDDAIAPYTRFVRAEREHLSATRTELEQIRENLARLAAECEQA